MQLQIHSHQTSSFLTLDALFDALCTTMVRAVNDTFDNDTIAAIVGAAVGALRGEAALPKRWHENLLGHTAEADDGKVFALLRAINPLL